MDARRLRIVQWPVTRPFCRVYDTQWGRDEFNPGYGRTRFAPIDDPGPIPTMYGGSDEAVALLESIFHDVGTRDSRIVYEASLRGHGLAHLSPPRSLRLLDLRNDALAVLGISRRQLVATSAAHYGCTREWALWLRGRRPGGPLPDGLLWESRQREVVGRRSGEVFVLWGDRAPSARGDYAVAGPGVSNLVEGLGRVLVEQIAESVDAVVVPG